MEEKQNIKPEVSSWAKEAPSSQVVENKELISSPKESLGGSVEMGINGVPIDLYRYFCVDIGSASPATIEKLRSINQLSSSLWSSNAERIDGIRAIERKMGKDYLRNPIDRVYGYLKLSKNIQDLEKQRNEMVS